ncbi:MAG: sigma-70 family RNA polymerase sigma factor [Candidatus Acidiferrales bacterium]
MSTEAADVETQALERPAASSAPGEFDRLFRAQYPRIARVIASVIRDAARAEDLAIEVFLKFWRINSGEMDKPEAWLHRVAVRKAIDDLRRQARRSRYESLFQFANHTPTPEDLRTTAEEKERVRAVLAGVNKRDAELLLLRANELSYDEMASALALNPASIGTLLARAQHAFRKEYIRRYGKR